MDDLSIKYEVDFTYDFFTDQLLDTPIYVQVPSRPKDKSWTSYCQQLNTKCYMPWVFQSACLLFIGTQLAVLWRREVIFFSKINFRKKDQIILPLHRGAFCQFPFGWIYHYGSNKSTEKKTGKTHVCALVWRILADLEVPHEIDSWYFHNLLGLWLQETFQNLSSFKQLWF